VRWADVVSLIRELLGGDSTGLDVAGVGVSAIGPCLLPLRPGILYGLDSRAKAQIGADTILEFSSMALSSQAVGPKLDFGGQQLQAVVLMDVRQEIGQCERSGVGRQQADQFRRTVAQPGGEVEFPCPLPGGSESETKV
jgi:hypothetical protein